MLSISLYEKSIPSDKRRWGHLVFNPREDEAKKHKFLGAELVVHSFYLIKTVLNFNYELPKRLGIQ